jgi:type VI secretion system protein ImpK
MSDNPFLEPDDNERTVLFRPTPGGRPAGAGIPPGTPPGTPLGTPPGTAPFPATPDPYAAVAAAAMAEEPVGPLVTGQSPLVVAAMPLLQLLGRMRNTARPPDPGALRLRAMQAVRDFETAARAAGIAQEVAHLARYVLCASVDDVALHTPWGRASPWVQASLVSTFHQEVISGEGFFYWLDRLKREPARNLMLLELMYLCLSLGYQGQYRVKPFTPEQLERVREDLYQTLVRLRQPYEQGLSPHWKGVAAPYRPARAVVPIWVMAAVALTVLALVWLGLSTRLNAASDRTLLVAATLPPTQLPQLERAPPPPTPAPRPLPPPPPAPSAVAATLHRFLQPEIDAGQVIVTESAQTVQVRIFNRGMFAVGSAAVRPDFERLLERIGEALNEEPGAVLVTGHTDNQPIHTAQFPSNFQLSVARADAASAVLLRRLRDPHRLTVEGRADSEPIASNDTPDGREQNRRIDIILQRRS